MELPRGIAAGSSAGLANKFVGFGIVFEAVKSGLDRTVYVVAEFSGFVFAVSV
jgi:hypothetical protein